MAFDLDVYVMTGQSLAEGETGARLSPHPEQPEARRLNDDGTLSGLRAVVSKQSPIYSLGASVFRLSGGLGYDGAYYLAAVGGAAYSLLKKDGTGDAYQDVIDAVTAGKTVADANGYDGFTVRALHIVHGEKDMGDGVTRATYLGYLNEWLSDYNTDLKAITGQGDDMIVFVSQTARWDQYAPATLASTGLSQLDFHRTNAAAYMACPQYPFAYTVQPLEVHLTAQSSYYLGEYHARVVKAVVLDGGTWEPVHPQSITVDGTTITATMHCPVEPLVLDTSTIAAQTNSGFTVFDDSGSPPSITSVSVSGAVVTIELDGTLGANPRLRYASAGTHLGNLRDSETATSALDGEPLPNWCCQFDDPIPYSES